MIYDGTTVHDNGESSTDREYGTSQFNEKEDNNAYLGYMYTLGEAHGLGNSSKIKTMNDQFYADKLSNYSSKLDTTVGFCGDRSAINLQSGVGTNKVITYMGGYLRVEQSTPSLICENESDYYTISNASKGNKALTYSIGLISSDEMLLAGSAGGIFDGKNVYVKPSKNGYLTIGNLFWTMTPAGYYNPYGFGYLLACMFNGTISGSYDDNGLHYALGLRPVINIRSDVTITGSGAKKDPYLVN